MKSARGRRPRRKVSRIAEPIRVIVPSDPLHEAFAKMPWPTLLRILLRLGPPKRKPAQERPGRKRRKLPAAQE
jgi:hypothetical protein